MVHPHIKALLEHYFRGGVSRFADGGSPSYDPNRNQVASPDTNQFSGGRPYGPMSAPMDYGFGANNGASPWGLNAGDYSKLQNQAAFQKGAGQGWVPGTGLTLDYGLAARNRNSPEMALFNQQDRKSVV